MIRNEKTRSANKYTIFFTCMLCGCPIHTHSHTIQIPKPKQYTHQTYTYKLYYINIYIQRLQFFYSCVIWYFCPLSYIFLLNKLKRRRNRSEQPYTKAQTHTLKQMHVCQFEKWLHVLKMERLKSKKIVQEMRCNTQKRHQYTSITHRQV